MATTDLYRAYRAELNAQRMTHHVRLGTIVSIGLSTAFLLLDWYVYPEYFQFFLSVRCSLNVLLLGIYFYGSVKYPVASEIGLCLAMGFGMLTIIYTTDAPHSAYYAGLVLVFVGMGVILPLTAWQSAGICSVLFLAYEACVLFTPLPVDRELFATHSVFLGSAAIMSISSCAFLDRVRSTAFAQRREIEQARDHLKEIDEAKSRFTANVHHELRTPLTLILAPLDALRSGELGQISEPVMKTLKTMQVNARRLHKLINNLLDLAKLESNEFELQKRPVELAGLVADLIEGARPLAERKGVALAVRGLDQVPPINADVDALEKILVNLLGNALKFTDAGVVTVAANAEHGGVLIRVIDTGIGLAANELDRIFDRFAQVDASATRRHEGTGIGLSLAQELTELHGGRIWAESQGRGTGTSMCVWLPIGVADGGSAEQVVRRSDGSAITLSDSMEATEAELNLDHSTSKGKAFPEIERTVVRWEGTTGAIADVTTPAHLRYAPEVLVAEDNPEMRELLGFLLAREFRVRLTRNGQEALEAINERLPALVLSDVMMPEMSGIELCSEIKQQERLRGIPVVLVTSKAEQEMKIEGLELGADDYVTKPFHPRELLARVRALIRVRSLQLELTEQNASLDRALRELREAEVRVIQAERLAAVGELAAGVAHEVNNPVNFAMNALRALREYVDEIQTIARDVSRIQGAASVGSDGRQYDEAPGGGKGQLDLEEAAASLHELVAIVIEGLERTHRLVADLRDFAVPGDGPRVSVDLRRGLESTIQLLKHGMREANVTTVFDADTNIPEVPGDTRALNQVFLNLLKNATEAFGESGGTITVRIRSEADSVVIEFEDDGPGLDPDVRERLFEPFFTTKGAGQGTGLGLAISRRIVSEHRGTLEVDSRPGEGTLFRVRLPIDGDDGAS